MENIPFLGLDKETATANGPISNDAIECDTQKKLAGQSEITVVLNKQVVYSLNLWYLSSSTHLLISEDCPSFKSTSNTVSFSGIRHSKSKHAMENKMPQSPASIIK